jgi:hypothetical protein
MKAKTSTDIDNVNASIRRWQTRLTRAVNTINRLTAKRTRLERKRNALPVGEVVATVTVPAASPAAVAVAKSVVAEAAPGKAVTPAPKDDGDIPAFLRRQKLPADEAAAAQIRAEQAELKKRKTAGRKAKKDAAKRGELRRMPLEGRAALAAIRGEA